MSDEYAAYIQEAERTAIRNATLEEAAKVADEGFYGAMSSDEARAAKAIAAAIRALKPTAG